MNIGTLTASGPQVSPPRSLLIIRVVNVVLIYLTKFPNFKILKAAHQWLTLLTSILFSCLLTVLKLRFHSVFIYSFLWNECGTFNSTRHCKVSRGFIDSSNLYSTVVTYSAGVCYPPAQMLARCRVLSPGSSSVICLRSLLRGWSAPGASLGKPEHSGLLTEIIWPSGNQ